MSMYRVIMIFIHRIEKIAGFRNTFKYSTLMCCLVGLLFSCRRFKDCESNLTIINNSDRDIVFGLKNIRPAGNKTLCYIGDTVTIRAKQNVKFYIMPCIQKGTHELDFYALDPSKVNIKGAPYECDSIEYYSKVLKFYHYPAAYAFKDINFTIVYEE